MQPSGTVGLIGFATNRAVPARRTRQGRYRSAVRRARRIQVGGEPFHPGQLHRRPPRGRHPTGGEPARAGLAGGRGIAQYRGRCTWTRWPIGRRCCATTRSPAVWSTGSVSATRPTHESPNWLVPKVFRRRPAAPTMMMHHRGCIWRAMRAPNGPSVPPVSIPGRKSKPTIAVVTLAGRSSAVAVGHNSRRSVPPAPAATPSPRRCAQRSPMTTSPRSCCGSTAPAGR